MTAEWFTTMPNPRTSATGHDAGQRGWKLHAVELHGGERTFGEIRRCKAACGLVPAHGWSLDLFIDARCERCQRALNRRATAAHHPKKR